MIHRAGRFIACGLLLFAVGCHRSPQTAAELGKALPRGFAGELHLQGEVEPRRLRVSPREVSIRSEHLLAFDRVAYAALDARGAVLAQGEVGLRGTISAPGLEIRLETADVTHSGAEEAIKPGTFTGKLAGDLQSLEAEWSTGLGQKAHLKMQASPPQ